MKKAILKISFAAASAALLAACASNPPQEPKYPPKCNGPYTPINAPSHYPAPAIHKDKK